MIRDNILATLAYYDVLDRPLTDGEVLRYLVKLGRFGANDPKAPALNDVKRGLVELKAEGLVSEYKGYYYIFGRRYLIPFRLKKERIAEKKWSRARGAVRYLKYIPFVKGIFASGSLALRNTDELSDLDIFIIAEHGHIWTVRFFTAFALQMLGMRRTNKHIIAPDKICANHFVTDRSLKVPFHSMYTAQLYVNLAPLYADRGIISEFRDKNNWVLDYLYTWDSGISTGHLIAGGKPRFSKFLEFLLRHTIAGLLERKLKSYQLKRISGQAGEMRGGRVTYSDEQLEFHPVSPEARIIPEYNRALSMLGLADFATERDSGLL